MNPSFEIVVDLQLYLLGDWLEACLALVTPTIAQPQDDCDPAVARSSLKGSSNESLDVVNAAPAVAGER